MNPVCAASPPPDTPVSAIYHPIPRFFLRLDLLSKLTYLLPLADYRETAAKLQKEWRIQAPHRTFDFAPHVKTYALVDVLNKGLVYQSLEWDFAQSQVSYLPSLQVTFLSFFTPCLGWATLNSGAAVLDESLRAFGSPSGSLAPRPVGLLFGAKPLLRPH